MGTWNSFYVRIVGASTIAYIQKEFAGVQILEGKDFLGVILVDDAFEPPSHKLIALSADWETEIIWLSFQSVVDSFEFHHWRQGQSLRSLIFGCYEREQCWEMVGGEPESWERAAFFDEEQAGASEVEIVQGDMDPSIDAREAARTVAEYYDLPGWS
jgi:hypothetical protein